MNNLRVRILIGFLVLFFSEIVLAAATVQAVSGEVLMAPGKGEYGALAFGQRVESGATVKTGGDGRVVLRFDDGQMISLTESSLFVVSDYKFNPHKPAEGNFLVSLFKGGMRAVTGAIGEANKSNVTIKTPVATMGIRGTDFQLFMENKLYINVVSGAIVATNDGGSMVFEAKGQASGQVQNAQTRPTAASPTVFPASAQGAFRIQQQQPLMGPVKDPNPKDPTCKDR